MSQNWEEMFSNWGRSPSPTDQAKAENAERAVRKAIDASAKLSAKPIEVFAQGSYANRTNVREDSDVDVCVLYTGAFFPDYSLSEGLTNEALGYGTSSYLYPEFKNDVEGALVSYFGRSYVVRGKKAFDVHANTYRIHADVVPCFEHRRICGSVQSHWQQCGTELHPDNGGIIVNWPQQNYDNGVQKNTDTRRRFKSIVRILKRLRNEMHDKGHGAAYPISSFLSECLVWNVPNEGFGHSTLTADVRYSLAHLWNNTRNDETCSEWGEINEKKYLFHSQKWTYQQVNTFLQAAWNYIGFQ